MSRPRNATPELPGGRLAATSLAVVIIATLGSFAAAQRLKRAPPLVKEWQAIKLLSPNGDAHWENARFNFKLIQSDTADIVVTTADGDPVRTLQRDVTITAYKQVKGSWNGSDDRGKLVPDGRYRIQLELQDAGRAVQLPFTITKDTTPPKPRLLSIGPEKTGPKADPRPELLPRADGKPIRVRFATAACASDPTQRCAIGRKPGIAVFRTDLVRPRMILDEPLAIGETSWTWDGTVKGRRVAQGTYVVAVHARDKAENVGWSTGVADPIAPFGERLKGQGGVTVRYLAAQSPQAAVAAGARAGIGIISPGKQYNWNVRRIGEQRARSRGKSRKPYLQPQVPKGPSGLHVFEVRAGDRTAQATVLTQSAKEEPVLVVIPATSLIGAQLVDDDGDGAPDTLVRGVSVQTARVPVDPALSKDMSERIAPLLLALDRKHRRYDLTTDLALARGQGPTLKGHKGVVLAGTASFVDAKLQRRLVAWVKRGGRLWVAEPESLRRSVNVTANAVTDPTQPSRLDPFGFELGPLQTVSFVVATNDRAKLLSGTDGKFNGPLEVEPVLRTPTGSTLLAEATTPGGGQPVLSAVRVDRGAVIRSGISGLGARAQRDADAREFLRQLWLYLRGA